MVPPKVVVTPCQRNRAGPTPRPWNESGPSVEV
jgi:hypothetical protein